MTEEGATYAEALAEAQSLGYAERDPTADVEGYDAGAKAAIIASHRLRRRVVAGDVDHEGIAGITAARHRLRRRLGYVVKLLAIAERDGADGRRVGVRVHPAMVPKTTRWPACATASTPCSSRARPSATSCSTAGRRGATRRPARCSATSSTRPPTCARAPTPAIGRWPGAIRPIDEPERSTT